MLSEPADANQGLTVSKFSSHEDKSDQRADNTNHHIKCAAIYAASPLPPTVHEQLLSATDLCPTTLDIHDAYYVETLNDDVDPDFLETSTAHDDADTIITAMLVNSYELTDEDYQEMLHERDDEWIAIRITFLDTDKFRQQQI
jgi:hypothetical protein